MGDREAGLRNYGPEMTGYVFDVLDAVVDEKHLTAAVKLAQDRFPQQAVVEMGDESTDRLAIDRRGLNHGQIPDSKHRHVQRPRDRRAGHGQHIDHLAQLFDSFLVGDAEPMLLVDNQQPQSLEFDVALKQAMGSDDDIDRAALQVFDHRLVLFGAAKARDHLDSDRIILEAGAEIEPVLLGQNRGRHQHGDLMPVHHGDAGRAQRDLGLAESRVAAEQTVHRLGPRHVADDVVDRRQLVGSLFELEALGELVILGARMGKSVPLLDFTRGVDIQQLGGHLQHRLFGALLDLLPGTAAELVELGLGAVAADVALNQVDPLDRDVERVVAEIFEVEKIPLGIGHLEMLEPAVKPDAVVDMDHVIAG